MEHKIGLTERVGPMLLTNAAAAEQKLPTNAAAAEQELLTNAAAAEQKLLTNAAAAEQKLPTNAAAAEQKLLTKATAIKKEGAKYFLATLFHVLGTGIEPVRAFLSTGF
jgi:hypothetical protein